MVSTQTELEHCAAEPVIDLILVPSSPTPIQFGVEGERSFSREW